MGPVGVVGADAWLVGENAGPARATTKQQANAEKRTARLTVDLRYSGKTEDRP
ncbi:MAG TPA: hypothetical protein VNP92_06860 [Actinophytocola sp.]|nr:hypothetical protein [Actinophytocola sp.]